MEAPAQATTVASDRGPTTGSTPSRSGQRSVGQEQTPGPLRRRRLYQHHRLSVPASPRTTLIGRIRKDAKLFAPPDPAQAKPKGRRKTYGDPLPTPETTRQDEQIPWTAVPAWAAGKIHSFRIQTVSPVRWRGTGDRNQRLVIIAPLGYRLSQKSRVLYRDPAYLLCTDPDLPLEKLLQDFLWRWGIEVNFRDEKTILGIGEAQVWTEQSVAFVPAFIAAAYAYLQRAAHAAYGQDGLCPLPNPKWQRPRPHERIHHRPNDQTPPSRTLGLRTGHRQFLRLRRRDPCRHEVGKMHNTLEISSDLRDEIAKRQRPEGSEDSSHVRQGVEKNRHRSRGAKDRHAGCVGQCVGPSDLDRG